MNTGKSLIPLRKILSSSLELRSLLGFVTALRVFKTMHHLVTPCIQQERDLFVLNGVPALRHFQPVSHPTTLLCARPDLTLPCRLTTGAPWFLNPFEAFPCSIQPLLCSTLTEIPDLLSPRELGTHQLHDSSQDLLCIECHSTEIYL